ncbi:MAG: DNA mismatch repair protein MutS [Bacteroidota bacterium]
MEQLFSFYTEQINTYKGTLSRIKKRLFMFSMLRLAVFLFAVFGIYLVYGNTKLIIAVIILAIALFVVLVSKHTDLQYKRDQLKALIRLNKTEINVLNRDFHGLPDGGEFKDPKHYYSRDIDLFGKGSFYQYCNRTSLREGSRMLAKILTQNSIDHIPQKQDAIKELAQLVVWRQRFMATAHMAKVETSTATIIQWINSHTSFVPALMRYVPLLFSVLSIGVFALYFLNYVPDSILIYWVLFGLMITAAYGRKITKLVSDISKILHTFQQYNKLLVFIEDTAFTSEWLQKERAHILSKGRKTSLTIQEFSKLLGGLDQNNNLIYLIFANGLFLRSLSHCYKIEQWIQNHGSSVEQWFNTIAFFDAYSSLGNFGFNHPNYVFPKISDGKIVLKLKGAAHPLLDPKKSVASDIQINDEKFFIVTGANMAGKSTFLRTVSLQIIMGNVGLPVCAVASEYSPIKLITSMRTSDSLTDDESYFFSELKRLKFIVDEIEEDNYFIVLDEILKGTNSTDKAIGSRKFVEKLVTSQSTGIIATHDLSLCELANEITSVENYYFDAEIINDELHFDYIFKRGICKNMNASFLLKKMEIVN